MSKIPRALTIAGSDSGGGAGIQADIKTFAALGVYGMSAITAVTAQNTNEVTAIQDVEAKIIEAQIDAVANDIGIDAAKTGMLHTSEIIELVTNKILEYGLPVVVDPVMVAKSGALLLNLDANETLVSRLLPIATIATPNALEAEKISGVKVVTLDDGKEAASIIAEKGAEAVLVKGGHIFSKDKAIDLLYFKGDYTVLEGERYATKDTHGTGCTLSAAIAAELAKGKNIIEAVRRAKDYINIAIRQSIRLGAGHGPLNHMAELVNDSDRYMVLENLREGVKILEAVPEMRDLVAEVQMNLGMSLSYASSIMDVAAIEGRITRRVEGIKASGCPRFGVSGHIARTILAVRQHNPVVRAGLNLRYSVKAIETCESLGLNVSYYDRREEPADRKNREGGTTWWGAEEAVKRLGRVPDVIYHLGDWGKEPMIVILGESATHVANKAVSIARAMEI